MSKVYLTRLIIETQSPMAINSGNREVGFDSQLARDANNLPYLPATSIVGVWRNLAQHIMPDQVDTWFGYTGKNQTQTNTAQSSVLTVSDGVIHNSKNVPVTGLLTPAQIEQDELLSLLVQARPFHRERVSINDRGVAKNTGKFDQILLPKGVRFCVDIKFYDDKLSNDIDTYKAQWKALVNCWQHPLFVLGASTRNGLGKVKIVANNTQEIDLTKPKKAIDHLRKFAEKTTIPTHCNLPESEEKCFAKLPLKALDNWRCGSGSVLLGKHQTDKTISMITYSESNVVWTNMKNKSKAYISAPSPVLCGSSIKGILAHRIAFHWRKHEANKGQANMWAHQMEDAHHQEWEKRPEVLKNLLGYADDQHHENSLAGSLYVEDCDVHFTDTVIRHHNSIDRFTGGVRKGALFSEELLYQPEFTLKLNIKPNTVLSNSLKQALIDTLDDLKQGLLPMGAGSGRGTSLVMCKSDNQWFVDLNAIRVLDDSKVEFSKINSQGEGV